MTAPYLPTLHHLPRPAAKNIAIFVTPAAEGALRQGHPWLYGDAIRRQSHEGAPGDLAVVFDRHRRFLSVGLYDPLSPIRVRILQHESPLPIDLDFFRERLQTALARRAPLYNAADTTGYRLVHGENDKLPGLVLDRYDRIGVLKLYTAAWIPHLRTLLPALLDLFSFERLVLRLSRNVVAGETFGLQNGETLMGPTVTRPVRFLENGLVFEADVVHGQKTGFFFDHRDNRARVEQYAGNRRLLNVFAYTGAFSLYAARGGAPRVLSLDSSQPALAAATRNFALNLDDPRVAASEHELLVGDAFQALRELRRQRRHFDMIVVDPPAFAKQQSEVERALGSYRRLTQDAIALLRPDGLLVMASCTARIHPDSFFQTIHEAARTVGYTLEELARTAHPLDHPVGYSEGAYLKCLFASLSS